MSLWLDSNALLWWLEGNSRLTADLNLRIDQEPSLYVSVLSPWELWIKAASGRLTMPSDLEERLVVRRITALAPDLKDARLAADLPPIHRDPFDRMIIAQALNRQSTIVTSDRVFADYGVDVILI